MGNADGLRVPQCTEAGGAGGAEGRTDLNFLACVACAGKGAALEGFDLAAP